MGRAMVEKQSYTETQNWQELLDYKNKAEKGLNDFAAHIGNLKTAVDNRTGTDKVNAQNLLDDLETAFADKVADINTAFGTNYTDGA